MEKELRAYIEFLENKLLTIESAAADVLNASYDGYLDSSTLKELESVVPDEILAYR